MFADYPKEEIARSWGLLTPVNFLSEPERTVIELVYADSARDEMIPVNADFKCYGISHGRALYSVSATKGKTISKMIFKDKMRNASFQILAATANLKLMPRVAQPEPHYGGRQVKHGMLFMVVQKQKQYLLNSGLLDLHQLLLSQAPGNGLQIKIPR